MLIFFVVNSLQIMRYSECFSAGQAANVLIGFSLLSASLSDLIGAAISLLAGSALTVKQQTRVRTIHEPKRFRSLATSTPSFNQSNQIDAAVDISLNISHLLHQLQALPVRNEAVLLFHVSNFFFFFTKTTF